MGDVDDLLTRQRLQRIVPDAGTVERLLADAGLHLRTADAALEGGDLAGAYQLGYDAARKALSAMLTHVGLRTREPGAHANLILAVRESYADLPGIEVVEKLERMRRTRNEAEYSGYPFETDLVRHDLITSRTIVELALGATAPHT